MNVYALFRRGFDGSLERCFVDAPSHASMTYAEADRRSARIGAALLALGIPKGGRVAARMQKSPASILLYFACLRAGMVFVPLDHRSPDAETERLLADIEPAVLVTDETTGVGSTLRRLTLDRDGHGTLGDLAAQTLPAGDVVDVSTEDSALILYTSGSTGTPKGVVWSHGFMADNALAQQRQWEFTRDDALLHVVSMAHSHGFSIALNGVLMGGSRLRLLPAFDVDQVIDELARVSVFSGVPTMYVRLLASQRLTPEACSNVRLFLTSSAALAPAEARSFEARSQQRLIHCYGLSETGTLACSSTAGPRGEGTVGTAWPGVALRVVDEHERPVPAGAAGRLQVKKAAIFSGYWRRPEASAECLTADGYFHTGDLASIDAEGFVRIVGRATDVVVAGGFNVHPREIELAFSRIGGVEEAVAFGVPHPTLGEAPIALVVAAAGARLDAQSLLASLRAELAPYKLPRWIGLVDALPRLAIGKVDARRLRAEYSEVFAAPASTHQPPAR